MKNRLFKKDIPHACQYCIHSQRFDSETEVLCRKRGVVKLHDSCGKYRYDALKRTPNITKISKNYTAEDFIL